MLNPFKKKRQVMPVIDDIDEFDIPWPTFEVFSQSEDAETFTDVYEGYEMFMEPNSLREFLKRVACSIASRVSFKNEATYRKACLHVTALGKDYLVYLKEHGEYDTPELRMEYIGSHQDDGQTIDILKERGFNKSIALRAAVFVSFGKAEPKTVQTSYMLDAPFRDCLGAALEKLYPGREVWIPGYVVKQADLAANKIRLIDLSKSWFYSRVKAYIHRFDTQEYEDGMREIEVYMIPFAVASDIRTTCFPLHELIDEANDDENKQLNEQDITELEAMLPRTVMGRRCVVASCIALPNHTFHVRINTKAVAERS